MPMPAPRRRARSSMRKLGLCRSTCGRVRPTRDGLHRAGHVLRCQESPRHRETGGVGNGIQAHSADRRRQRGDSHLVVDDRRHTPEVVEAVRHPERSDHSPMILRTNGSSSTQIHAPRYGRYRRRPSCGMAFGALPECTDPRHHGPRRGSTRRDSAAGQPGDDGPDGGDQVGGQVAGTCSAGVEGDVDVVGGRGQRSGPQTHRPDGSRGSQCRAKIRLTSASTPASIASSAPPGITSSAAWKISRTRPAGRRHRPATHRWPAASPCASRPHAWETASTSGTERQTGVFR